MDLRWKISDRCNSYGFFFPYTFNSFPYFSFCFNLRSLPWFSSSSRKRSSMEREK
jgi:hypothetical protein